MHKSSMYSMHTHTHVKKMSTLPYTQKPLAKKDWRKIRIYKHVNNVEEIDMFG